MNNNDGEQQWRQTTTTTTTTKLTTKRLEGEVIQKSALDAKNDEVKQKQRCRTKTIVDRKRQHQTTNNETWEGGKYNNTTLSINLLVGQSFDVKRKRRHQTTTTSNNDDNVRDSRGGGNLKIQQST
jgi:hypothetical protein